MQSLNEDIDIVVYVQSLLKEGFALPYYNISKLLKVYHYQLSEIKFIKPTKKQQRLTLHSIRENQNGITLTVFEESWANYLPQVYRNNTLEEFLYGFQLSMFKYTEAIDNMEELFTPEKTPDEFVEWLASWFNMSFSHNIKLKNRRKIIYKLTFLYNSKGTKKYLTEIVLLLTDIHISIKERAVLDSFSMINKNLSFIVTIQKEPDYQDDYNKGLMHQIVKEIIENEKPIFTNALFDGSFILSTAKIPLSTPIVEEKEVIYNKENLEEKEKTQEKKSGYEDFF